MAYLNVDLDYFEHKKTKRLIGLIGRGAEVLPLRLWSYCGKFHCEDGRLAGYSEQEIESIVEWWGKPGHMVPAMCKAGFISPIKRGGYNVRSWEEHQGHLAAFKRKGREMAHKRWAKYRSENHAGSIAVSIAERGPPALPDITVPTDPTIKRLIGANGADPPAQQAQITRAGVNGHGLNVKRSPLNRSKEKELMGALREILGDSEMQTTGGHWRSDHVRKHPELLERCIAEVRRMKKEGERFTINAAACLEDLVKRWKE